MTTPPENSIQPGTRAKWRAWLQENSARPQGIWVISFKKSSGQAGPDYDDIVEEGLCFGWIDSKGKKLDEQRTMLWMGPRQRHSGWSRPNKERIEMLIQNGLMAAPGLALIEAAKQDGSWNALDAIEALEVPSDLAEALAAHPPAQANFAAFPRSAKRAILVWISEAKQPTTRHARIAETARLAAENRRARP